jgi:hypothetical protein
MSWLVGSLGVSLKLGVEVACVGRIPRLTCQCGPDRRPRFEADPVNVARSPTSSAQSLRAVKLSGRVGDKYLCDGSPTARPPVI